MRTKLTWLLIGIFSALFPLQGVFAQDLFYSGDVVIESMVVHVDIGNVAQFTAEYVLHNIGDQQEEVILGFMEPNASIKIDGKNLDGSVVFDPEEKKTISLSCFLETVGETTKTLSFDPNLLINDKPSGTLVESILIHVLLPEDVDQLAWASQDPSEENLQSGRMGYSWAEANVYAIPLSVKWNTLGVNLSVVKSINPDTIDVYGQLIKVTINVQNNGSIALENIQLIDRYSLSDFEGIEPQNQFSQENNILFWSGAIESLEPGAIKTISYLMKHIGYIPADHVLEMKPCSVFVDGNLVRVSNKVRLSQAGDSGLLISDSEALPVIEESTGFRFPSIPVIGGILIGLIAIAVVTIILVKKKRSKKKTDHQAFIRKREN